MAEEAHSLDAFDANAAKAALDETTVSILVYFFSHRWRWCRFDLYIFKTMRLSLYQLYFEHNLCLIRRKILFLKFILSIFSFSVQILAEEAHSLDAFDSNAAKAALDEATVSILVYFFNHRWRRC